jgi:hypothetical protein
MVVFVPHGAVTAVTVEPVSEAGSFWRTPTPCWNVWISRTILLEAATADSEDREGMGKEAQPAVAVERGDVAKVAAFKSPAVRRAWQA